MMDFNIELNSRQILRGFIMSPGEKLRAVVIMVHGLGEHIMRYSSWAGLFSKSMIGFAGVDLPGHGRSEGKRGHIRSFEQLDEMTDILIDQCRKTFPGVPLFLYGHSLGGGYVLNYLVRKKPRLKGAVVTSPWLKLTFEPDKTKVRLASLVRRIYPGFVTPSGLVVEHISHDTDVIEKYKKDPLVHGKISVSLFHAAMNAAAFTLANAPMLATPLLLVHGRDDLICSPGGSMEFVSKAKGAEIKIWDGGYHELHNEPFGEEVFEFIMSWINRRIGN